MAIVTVLPRQPGLRIELGQVFDDCELRFEPHASALVCRGQSIVEHPTAPILCTRFDRVRGDVLQASYHVDLEGVVQRIDFRGGRLEFCGQGQVALSEGRASGSLLADG